MHHLNHFSVYSSVALKDIHIMHSPQHSSPEISHLPKLKLSPRSTLELPMTSPSPHLNDSSRDLLKVESQYFFVLLCLADFTKHNVLRCIHIVTGVRTSFLRLNYIPLSGKTTFCVSVVCEWTVGWFLFSGHRESCCYVHGCATISVRLGFQFSWVYMDVPQLTVGLCPHKSIVSHMHLMHLTY